VPRSTDPPSPREARDGRRRLFLLLVLVIGLLLLAGGAYLLVAGSTPDEVAAVHGRPPGTADLERATLGRWRPHGSPAAGRI
jgi:hypothetical protein